MIRDLWKDAKAHPFIYIGMLGVSLVTVYAVLEAIYSMPVR